jgi:hypothetical protein
VFIGIFFDFMDYSLELYVIIVELLSFGGVVVPFFFYFLGFVQLEPSVGWRF